MRYAAYGSGGGGSSLPTSVTFGLTWDTAASKDMGTYTATGALAFVSSDTSSVVGGSTFAVIVPAGFNATFDGASNAGWLTGANGPYMGFFQRSLVGSDFTTGPIAGLNCGVPAGTSALWVGSTMGVKMMDYATVAVEEFGINAVNLNNSKAIWGAARAKGLRVIRTMLRALY